MRGCCKVRRERREAKAAAKSWAAKNVAEATTVSIHRPRPGTCNPMHPGLQPDAPGRTHPACSRRTRAVAPCLLDLAG